jgi:hypothetical protein
MHNEEQQPGYEKETIIDRPSWHSSSYSSVDVPKKMLKILLLK